MIDKNGKLFGKINIIDLTFLVILLAAALFVLYRAGVFSPEKAAASEDRMRLIMFQEEVNEFTASNTKPGDPVTESFQNISFGKLVSIETGDSINWGADQEGKQVKTKKEGFVSARLVMETPGKVSSSGLTIGGSKYYVGQVLVIRVGKATYYARIESAEQIN
ncbi:MAG: DUF4330 domain-containing protein [Clostridiaceae bacterium]|jgi:hypothetical protein|nr:DUF4330 domain-containing protein [Clostridiaceae bacterium]